MQTVASAITKEARRRAQQGQTIVIALLVLLLLGFIGGLFASIVTRNLRSAARSNRVQTADYYAEAGVRYADDQLTHNPDGADWRPPMQYQLVASAQPKDTLGSARYTSAVTTLKPPTVDPNDPDRAYLEQGYARYNLSAGRFLLRLTYDPAGVNTNGGAATADPRGRYIKIESVGREGAVDPNDPTTYQNQIATRLAATLVEYKAIGITDYARFETNPDKRSDVMALGVAAAEYVYDFDSNSTTNGGAPLTAAPVAYPLAVTYGSPYAYLGAAGGTLTPNPTPDVPPAAGTSYQAGGGAIHVNGTVRFSGLNYMYLNNTNQNTGSFGETAEIAGNLLLDNYQPTDNTGAAQPLDKQDGALVLNPAAGGAALTDYVFPSNDTTNPFDTHSGLVRDAATTSDAHGQPRSVNRLDPPAVDTVNPASSLPRYRDIASNSLPNTDVPNDPNTKAPIANAALYGYGQAIYINNPSDTQSENSSLVGGYTLVDEWLHRTPSGTGRTAWAAGFYRPPGAEIVLGRQQVPTTGAGGVASSKTFYGVRITRSDTDAAGKPVLWKDPNPAVSTSAATDWVNNHNDLSATLVVPYTSLNASHTIDPNALGAAAPNTQAAFQANPNNDVVIYAEGNVRVRGVVSSNGNGAQTDEMLAVDTLPRHVTIVTNGTAYIDGSLLKGNPQSSISVLAHDYVCVNTTQFLAGAISDETPSGTTPPIAVSGDPSLQALDFSTSDEVLLQELQYNAPEVAANTNAATPALYVSGGPSGSGNTSADFDIVNADTGYSLIAGSTNRLFQAPQSQLFTSLSTTANGLTHTTYPLAPPSINTALTDGTDYQFAVRRTPAPANLSDTQDFLLERAAVLPSDVRIEAVLFAQTRSFFVIPGDWFNTDVKDNLAEFHATKTRDGIDTTQDAQNRFPFYGQPIDMKIIISGSVSEAQPADIAAQTAWMQKWGWIPLYHGTVTANAGGVVGPEASNRYTSPKTAGGQTPAPGGITLVYNPLAGYPYYQGSYIRTDVYGRPLPYTPKLPVCAGLLYAGQNSADQVILP